MGDLPENGPTLLPINRDEDSPLNQAQRLSRSPHPYIRHRVEILQSHGEAAASLSEDFLPTRPNPTDKDAGYADGSFSGITNRRRRKELELPDDSGTEADDERGTFLLGLPAPPLRPRKGLKDQHEAASPPLTPSIIDDVHRRSAFEARTNRRTSLHSGTTTDEETVKLREKFTRRRRAELIRRVSETILLLVVCYISCKSDLDLFSHQWAKGRQASGWPEVEVGTTFIRTSVLIHITTVLGLYTLYPLRIIFKNHALSAARKRSRFYIHIPAAFDPAPLLYPILLPVVGSLSIKSPNLQLVLSTLTLSLAAIPSKIIPFGVLPWYSSPQWILSTLPIIIPQAWAQNNDQTSMNDPQISMITSHDVESLILLYPLHQALLPVLGSLTTTSLLPAELQLLSISLIDLLRFSASPQALILKSLLWIGGISILTLCGRILSWVVALARIPSWRFRRPRAQTRHGVSMIDAINDLCRGQLTSWGLISRSCEDSDSDDSEMRRRLSLRQRKQKTLRIDINGARRTDGFMHVKPILTKPLSALGDGKESGFQDMSSAFETHQLEKKHQRRYTLPSYQNPPIDLLNSESPKRSATRQSSQTKPWSFRSSTASQAVVLKWLFAIYVYSVTAVTILVPIRIYVRRFPLRGQEPVGWALGYLFGDLASFRSFTLSWNLDQWICLPVGGTDNTFYANLRSTGLFPLIHLGAATTRLLVSGYCLSIIALGLFIVAQLSVIVEVDTRRKVFHGMMVFMFLPTIFVDPTFVSLAFILILSIFLLLDLFRASQLPPLSRPLTYFLAPYVDGRDHRGPIVISHIFLLIGCAIPLWLSLASIPRVGDGPWQGWDVPTRDLSMISGVVCVGMGDAAASLIGRRYGRRRWCWSGGKSFEGSFAFALAVVLGLVAARAWLLAGGWEGDSGDTWATTLGKAAIAATGASLTEAGLTGGNDNVIVPIILWLLVRGLDM